jgi:hypothetical protein
MTVLLDYTVITLEPVMFHQHLALHAKDKLTAVDTMLFAMQELASQ